VYREAISNLYNQPPFPMQPFVSESHSTPAPRGHIWAQFEFGDQIGEDGRYTIVRKLGGGMFSSTWLARDSTSVYHQL